MSATPYKFIAGYYKATYAGGANAAYFGTSPVALGCTLDGFKIGDKNLFQDVKTDCTGESLADAVFEGKQISIQCTFMECGGTNFQKLSDYFSVTTAGSVGVDATAMIGQLLVAGGLAGQLVLTRAAGNSATQVGYTFPLTRIDGVDFNLSNKVKQMTVTFEVFIDAAGVFYTEQTS